MDKALQNPNTKMIIDFGFESSVNINSLAVNNVNVDNVKVILLMFAKLSLMNFIYELPFIFQIKNNQNL